MNICVVTLGNKNIEEYSKYSFAINKKYCEHHGYTYIQHNDVLDSKRPATWSKIIAVKQQIRNFDWIFWIDADAIFFNHDIRIEDITDNNHYFFASKGMGDAWIKQYHSNDENLFNLNVGTFIIKGKIAWSYSLLENWYSRDERLNHHWLDNQAFSDLYLEGNEYFTSRIKLEEQKVLNGFEQGLYCYEDFSPEQYVLHYAGIPHADRIYLLGVRHAEMLDGKFSGEKKKERNTLVQ